MCYHSASGWTREQWQWRGTLHSPKLQHYWNLTIRFFRVISKTLVGGWGVSAEMQSVYSAARAGTLRVRGIYIHFKETQNWTLIIGYSKYSFGGDGLKLLARSTVGTFFCPSNLVNSFWFLFLEDGNNYPFKFYFNLTKPLKYFLLCRSMTGFTFNCFFIYFLMEFFF